MERIPTFEIISTHRWPYIDAPSWHQIVSEFNDLQQESGSRAHPKLWSPWNRNVVVSDKLATDNTKVTCALIVLSIGGYIFGTSQTVEAFVVLKSHGTIN